MWKHATACSAVDVSFCDGNISLCDYTENFASILHESRNQ